MKYIINKDNFRNFDVVEINKLPKRAYFIPYPTKELLNNQTILTTRYSSPMVDVLNGEWDFVYYEKESNVPTELDTDSITFDKVTVPSTWQRTGYRNPCYLNQRYEFNPKLYPNLPSDVPLGIYHKTIDILDNNKVYILSFLGVISSIDLYVNGIAVGYSEGAHNLHEFDISKYLKKGTNDILVVVSKWSTGTYLECQDMFRENGIFRDVLLYKLDNTYLYNYTLDTTKNGDLYDLNLQLDIKGDTKDYTITAELFDNDKIIANITQQAVNNTKLTLKNLVVAEWNAEVPKTYDLIITLSNGTNTSVIKNITGFKHIEIKDNIFYFNNKPIKLKGVNHHDTDMDKGYCRTCAETIKELQLMKKFNINCIRTSHYPPDPILLDIADTLGFYIVDEADIETHGTYECKVGATEHLISNDLKWENRFLDRVSRMFYRDRNHPSITMWSLGNEAGGYACEDSCYNYLHKNSNIPVHYEGVIRSKRFAYDVISEMYPRHDHVEKVGKLEKEKYKNKPYFMCEYCHAMGVGPGAVEEYWQSIYNHDNLLGGCIWEWADHAVHHTNGKYQFTYGGDHGEQKHDKNFCVDGMLFPDKTPHTGAFVIGAVYRPIRSEYLGNNEYKFTNTNRFRNSSYLDVKYSVLKNGIVVDTKPLKLDIDAMDSKIITIPYEIDSKDLFVNIEYYENNIKIATEQHIINNSLHFEIEKGANKTEVEDISLLKVKFDNGEAIFDKNIGLISYTKNGIDYLNQNPKQAKAILPNLIRASVDNDSFGFKKPWEKIKLDKAITKVSKFSYNNDQNATIVTIEYVIKNMVKYFTVKLDYTIYSNGLIKVNATLNKNHFGSTEIQRFGVFMELPTNFTNVKFYGRGNYEKMENLPDLLLHTTVGYFDSTVQKLHEDYIMPQDNTNIGDCKMLEISNNTNKILVVTEDKFSFSIHDYTQDNLDKAKHIEDITRDTIMLSIDGFMRGTGTNTCGEDTLDKYKVDTKKLLDFSFSFIGK